MCLVLIYMNNLGNRPVGVLQWQFHLFCGLDIGWAEIWTAELRSTQDSGKEAEKRHCPLSPRHRPPSNAVVLSQFGFIFGWRTMTTDSCRNSATTVSRMNYSRMGTKLLVTGIAFEWMMWEWGHSLQGGMQTGWSKANCCCPWLQYSLALFDVWPYCDKETYRRVTVHTYVHVYAFVVSADADGQSVESCWFAPGLHSLGEKRSHWNQPKHPNSSHVRPILWTDGLVTSRFGYISNDSCPVLYKHCTAV